MQLVFTARQPQPDRTTTDAHPPLGGPATTWADGDTPRRGNTPDPTSKSSSLPARKDGAQLLNFG
jgi:hypothetical protein